MSKRNPVDEARWETAPSGAPETPRKRPYATPSLTRYGTVVAITGSMAFSSFRDTKTGNNITANLKIKN